MMKNDVDKRVVEFEFDNRNFDKNVKKSEKTLRNFEETLQFKDVSKSLDVIKMKFSTMEIVMASTIRNITDRVVNLGIRLVKSLSVDNLAAGWQKFGEKTIAVGTLMSQSLKIAGKEIEDYSEKMEVVNDQLDKLNWFTDETSYNFTDMVDNIGKFTAAGQDLDKSVEAMMGIANWAALSGQNAATASRAMYQLSQALGKGYVQLIDYKSIQNANMDTQEFRKTVLETAVAMGELTKEGQDYLTKTGKKFSQNQFAEQLNAKWFTSDVLTASLKKYSSAVDKLYEITEKEGITASEAIELYGDQFEDLGIKAFKAAQEARTFSDAINSVKDAVSTGWMTTAEMIFGSYDEAKEFWTQLANELYDVFAQSGNIRNEILAIWKALEGRSDLFKRGGADQGAFWNLYDSIIAVRDAFSNAWNIIFPKTEFEEEADQVNDIAHNLKIFTSNLQKSTARIKEFFETNEDLQQILEGMFSLVKVFVATLEALRYALDPIMYALKQIALSIANIFADLGRQLSSSTGYAEALLKAASKINEFLTFIFQSINLPKVLEKVVSILKALFKSTKEILDSVGTFLRQHADFGKVLQTISSGLRKLTNAVKSFFDELGKGATNLKDGIFGKLFGAKTASKGAKVEEEETEETYNILKAMQKLGIEIFNLLKTLYPLAYSIVVLATSMVESLAKGIKSLTDWILKIADFQSDAFKSLKFILGFAGLAFIAVKIGEMIFNIIWLFEYMKGNIFSTLDDLADAARKWGKAKIIESIGSALKSLGLGFLMIVAGLKLLEGVSWKTILKGIAILLSISSIVAVFAITSKKMKTSFNLLKKNAGVLSGKSEQSSLYAVSDLMRSLALSMVGLALSLRLIKDVENDDFDRFLVAMFLMSGVMLGIQWIDKKSGKVQSSINHLLPTMFQMLGFALSMKFIIRTMFWATEKLEDMAWNLRVRFYVIATAVSLFIIALAAITTALRKAQNITGSTRSLTINLGSRLGGALAGIALLVASVAASAYVITLMGDKATNALIWISSIVGGIFVLAIVLQIIMNAGIKKLVTLGGDKPLKRDNPVAVMLASIAAMLLSVAVAVLAISSIEDPMKVFTALGLISVFIGILVGLIALTKLIPNKGIGTSDPYKGIGKVIGSIAGLLLAITVVVAVLTMLPDEDRVTKTLIVVGAIVAGFLALILVISRAMSSGAAGKSVLGFIAFIAGLAAFGAALAAIGWGLGYLQKSVKIDWDFLKYLGLIVGIFVALGAITAFAPQLAGGIAAIAGAFIVVGASFWVLGWGINKAADGINKLTSEGVNALTKLFEAFSNIDIFGVLGALIDGWAIGLGLESLGDGLQHLVGPMKELTADGVNAVASLVSAFTKTTVGGLLAALFGGQLIGKGLSSLGNGLYDLVGPLSVLNINGVEAVAALVSAFTRCTVSGFLASLIGGAAIGNGMKDLASGIGALIVPLKQWNSTLHDNLFELLSLISGNFGGRFTGFDQWLAGIFNSSNADMIRKALENIGDGFLAVIRPLNQMRPDAVNALDGLGRIIDICGKYNQINTSNFKAVIDILEHIPNFYVNRDFVNEVIKLTTYIEKLSNLHLNDEDFSIKPTIDLTEFESGYNRLSDMLSSLSGKSVNLSSQLAGIVSAGLQNNSSQGSITNNNNTSYNDSYSITMNIETNDPYEIAEELDKIFQERRVQHKLAKGGA